MDDGAAETQQQRSNSLKHLQMKAIERMKKSAHKEAEKRKRAEDIESDLENQGEEEELRNVDMGQQMAIKGGATGADSDEEPCSVEHDVLAEVEQVSLDTESSPW